MPEMTVWNEPAVDEKENPPANKQYKQRGAPGIIRKCYKSLFDEFQETASYFVLSDHISTTDGAGQLYRDLLE